MDRGEETRSEGRGEVGERTEKRRGKEEEKRGGEGLEMGEERRGEEG